MKIEKFALFLFCVLFHYSLCYIKNLRGLSIRNAEHQNKVHILNLIWRFNHSPHKIQTKILTNKHGSNLSKRRTNQSYTYISIQQTLTLYHSCVKTIIGDGKNTNIWYDNWLNKPLRQKIYGPIPQNEEKNNVNSIMKGNTNHIYYYTKDMLFQIQKQMLLEILAQPIAQNQPFYKINKYGILKKNGILTSKSTYLFVLNKSSKPQTYTNSQNQPKMSWIWKTPTHLRDQFFLWQAYTKKATY